MRYLIASMLAVVGIIHLLPLSGALGADQLATLYGVNFSETNLEILMRHRAVLFGLLGLLLLYAAVSPPLRTLAFSAGFISTASFLWLAWSVGGYNAQLSRVVTADIVAIVCIIIGGTTHMLIQHKSSLQK